MLLVNLSNDFFNLDVISFFILIIIDCIFYFLTIYILILNLLINYTNFIIITNQLIKILFYKIIYIIYISFIFIF